MYEVKLFMRINEKEDKKVDVYQIYVLAKKDGSAFKFLVSNDDGQKYLEVSTGKVLKGDQLKIYEEMDFNLDYAPYIPVFTGIGRYSLSQFSEYEGRVLLSELHKFARFVNPPKSSIIRNLGIKSRPVTIKKLISVENSINDKIRMRAQMNGANGREDFERDI